MDEPVQLKVRNDFRLAKQDDDGNYLEFACWGDDLPLTIVTPESHPEEFARLLVIERESVQRHKASQHVGSTF